MYSVPDKTKGSGVSATSYEHNVNLISLYVILCMQDACYLCNYIPSSILLFCGYVVNYDENYDVIYEIIMRKFGAALLGPENQ